MKKIQILGSGCAKCVKAAEVIQEVADSCGVQVIIVKESSPELILKYGVMTTPAVVVDSQMVHSGSVPDKKVIEQWIK